MPPSSSGRTCSWRRSTGTFWLVSASDEVLARVERTFDDAREVDPAAIRLSIWPRDYGPEGPRLMPLQIDVP